MLTPGAHYTRINVDQQVRNKVKGTSVFDRPTKKMTLKILSYMCIMNSLACVPLIIITPQDEKLVGIGFC